MQLSFLSGLFHDILPDSSLQTLSTKEATILLFFCCVLLFFSKYLLFAILLKIVYTPRIMNRENLGSRLGFILLSAGCAIGIGNVWKFPYMVGSYGGGAFVLFYLLFLAILGLPIMVMEFSIGRSAQKSPIKMFNSLEQPGQKWHLHGYICFIANYIIMMFYTTVSGWMLYYFYASVRGLYTTLDTTGIENLFINLTQSPVTMGICMIITVMAGFLILSFGLQNGLEKITKVMMVMLLVLIVVLAFHSILLKGGSEGIIFYLKPDTTKIRQAGLGNVILGAMNQAFFTLSIGIGSIAIFGSYTDKQHTLLGESINVVILDTAVAICSGLIIFPACSAYNIAVDSGPSLLFITLPNVFNHLKTGRIWGSMFFLFMIFASFSTVLGVFENIISMNMDLFGCSRKKACFINIPVMTILSMPCVLGFNMLDFIQPLGKGSNILDLEDFIVSNLCLPLGSLIIVLFCVTKAGWGWDNFINEANTGKGFKLKNWLRPYMTCVLPCIIMCIFLIGIIGR